MKELISALIGGLVVVIAQYAITYKLIEKPKLELENKRAELEKQRMVIEAQKQIALLTPNIKSNCKIQANGIWTFKINCEMQNIGQYATLVKIADVDVAIDDVSARVLGDTEAVVKFVDDVHEYIAPPSSFGTLSFYINLDKDAFPHGAINSRLRATITLGYRVKGVITNTLTEAFPEMKEFVDDIAIGGLKINLHLPKTVHKESKKLRISTN